MTGSEHVTVLFTDMVGSTERSSRLPVAEADSLRRTHFSLLRRAIASCEGTEVKNLGDGVMVVFRGASSALACAVAMQQAIDAQNRSAFEQIGLRIGISCGEATNEGDDYFGDPVVEAARLCARAGAGQILVSEVVRATAGRRSPHSFGSMGAIELKGLPEPLEVLEVDWAALSDSDALGVDDIPLPGRLAHRPQVGVIGRDRELAELEEAAKHVASGAGRRVILVAGEPGQGKSTLVADVARRAFDSGMTILLGQCDEEVGAPYRPFHEAIGHYVAHAHEGHLQSHVDAHGAELARLVPALRQRLGGLPAAQTSDEDTERYLLFEAVAGLLDRAGVDKPVVLVLDDLHWADKPSLQLFRHLVAQCLDSRLLVLGTYRDAELSANHPLTETLGALRREDGVTRIDLKGLDDTGVLSFMESAAGHELDDDGINLAHAVYRETDGNPFFVAEVLRHLSESGAIVQTTEGRWVAGRSGEDIALPDSIREVISARVSRLGEASDKMLAVAAVIGREFDLELLGAVTGTDEQRLLDLLEHARSAALVREVPGAIGRYSFSHALVQHTLYEDLGGTRRAILHREVGEALERLYGGRITERVGELARHFLLATRPSDAEKAIDYARQAGEAALAALAPDQALRYFSQALELIAQGAAAEPAVRIDLLIGLGTAQRRAGIPAHRETLLEAARNARQVGDTDRLVNAALANTRGFFSSLGHADSEKVEVLETCLSLLPEIDSPRRARVLATLCAEVTYSSPITRRLALADEAKAIARRLGDTFTLVGVIDQTATALLAPSTVEAQQADLAEAMAAALALNDPTALLRTAQVAYIAAIRAGQFDLAREHLTLQQELVDRFRKPASLWTANTYAASWALLQGNIGEAERLATAALEIGRACGQPDAFGFYAIQLMATRDQQGRLAELLPLIAQAADDNPSIRGFRAALAAAELEAGDRLAAEELLEEAGSQSFTFGEDLSWHDTMYYYAKVAVELPNPVHAETLFELMAPFHGQVPHTGLIPQPPVATSLGALATVIGRYEEAERYFEEAAELNSRGQMLYAEAETNMLWGRMLRQRGGPGDAERAHDLLVQARSSAANLGYAMIGRKAATELLKLS